MTNKLGIAQRSSYRAVDSSRGAVLQLLFSNNEISRAHLSRVSGLSKQTISSVIAELEASNLVESVGNTEGGIGRRAITYRLSSKAGYAVGIDLGGTNFRAGLVDFSGTVLGEIAVETPHSTIQELEFIMESAIDTLFKNAKVAHNALAQIVMGIPGVVNPITGKVSNTPNIGYLNGVQLSEFFKSKFNVPVLIENDVNVAALGELESSETEDFGFLAIGTGVGMGLILDGELRRGFSGGAGEIGYMPLGPNAHRTSVEGHFEEMVGGNSLELSFKETSGSELNLIEIFNLAQKGDATAGNLVDGLGVNIALGIQAICSVLDLGEIILGGGIGSREDLLLQIRTNLRRTMSNPPNVRISKLGTRAGLIGAMSYALSEMRGKVLTSGSLLRMGNL
jgi:predicted NBD/HSP70 family sugar kinase